MAFRCIFSLGSKGLNKKAKVLDSSSSSSDIDSKSGSLSTSAAAATQQEARLVPGRDMVLQL